MNESKIHTLYPWAKPGEVLDLNPNATPAERMARKVVVRRVKSRKKRALARERASQDPEYAELLRKKDRERYNTKRREKRSERNLGYNREYRKRPEVIARAKEQYEKKDYLVKKAHWAVNNAIRTGKMKRQPCGKCNTENGHAHHDDYSKPLEVRWLCRKCHGREHSKFKNEQP